MIQKNQKSDIADILLSLRKMANYSQETVADKIGIKRDTYAQYERQTNPPVEIIRKLCKLYGVSSDVILSVVPSSDSLGSNRMGQLKFSQPTTFTPNQQQQQSIYPLDDDEIILVERFRLLPNGKKEYYIAQITKDGEIELK